jgi:nucleoside-diphosphate-sugar epimerase
VKHVAVTGAAGFIGSRLAEVLSQKGVTVHAVVRRGSNAARIARHANVQLSAGDVRSCDFLRETFASCDTVFHCAYGNRGSLDEQRSVTVEGTANVLSACTAAGVRRLVHLSSVAVWGYDASGTINECTPYPSSLSGYCLFKREAEDQIARLVAAPNAPSVAILLPTMVYGPYSPFVLDTMTRLADGRFGLPTSPGLANHIYVDDLIDAMLCAAAAPHAGVEKFIVTDPNPECCRLFFGRFAAILNIATVPSGRLAEDLPARPPLMKAIRSVTSDQDVRKLVASIPGVQTLYKLTRSRHSPSARANRGATPKPLAGLDAAREKAAPLMSRNEWACYSATASFDGSKAAKTLGFTPLFGLEHGIRLTTLWLRDIGACAREQIDDSVDALAEHQTLTPEFSH